MIPLGRQEGTQPVIAPPESVRKSYRRIVHAGRHFAFLTAMHERVLKQVYHCEYSGQSDMDVGRRSVDRARVL